MRSPEIETVSPSMMIGVSEAPPVLATRATACGWYRLFALPAVVCKPRTIQAPRPLVAARVTPFQQTDLYVHLQISAGVPIASRRSASHGWHMAHWERSSYVPSPQAPEPKGYLK
jgi:hypothetical protein